MTSEAVLYILLLFERLDPIFIFVPIHNHEKQYI